eukprot:m.63423 g.63423  ORF g.63423 m.63423 type:complete len:349 (+) comp8068_c0_seq1:237-1283(+)
MFELDRVENRKNYNFNYFSWIKRCLYALFLMALGAALCLTVIKLRKLHLTPFSNMESVKTSFPLIHESVPVQTRHLMQTSHIGINYHPKTNESIISIHDLTDQILYEKKHPNNVCVASAIFTEKYLELLPYWLNSLRHSGFDGPVFILTKEAIATQLGKFPKVTWVMLTSGESHHSWSTQYKDQFLKYHLWDLPCKQVAYFDSDMVFVGPVVDVFDLCASATFCAVPDIGQSLLYERTMFNGGMMVLRPTLERSQALWEYFSHAEKSKFMEQDWLNAALGSGRTLYLPPIYNTLNGCKKVPQWEKSDIRVCHCASSKFSVDDKIRCLSEVSSEFGIPPPPDNYFSTKK